MMQNSGDQDSIFIDAVKNPMTPMNHTANTDTEIGSLFSAQGEGFKSGENPIDAALIGIGCVVAEPFRTVSIDFGQVGTRRFAQPDFRHAVRDVRR